MATVIRSVPICAIRSQRRRTAKQAVDEVVATLHQSVKTLAAYVNAMQLVTGLNLPGDASQIMLLHGLGCRQKFHTQKNVAPEKKEAKNCEDILDELNIQCEDAPHSEDILREEEVHFQKAHSQEAHCQEAHSQDVRLEDQVEDAVPEHKSEVGFTAQSEVCFSADSLEAALLACDYGGADLRCKLSQFVEDEYLIPNSVDNPDISKPALYDELSVESKEIAAKYPDELMRDDLGTLRLSKEHQPFQFNVSATEFVPTMAVRFAPEVDIVELDLCGTNPKNVKKKAVHVARRPSLRALRAELLQDSCPDQEDVRMNDAPRAFYMDEFLGTLHKGPFFLANRLLQKMIRLKTRSPMNWQWKKWPCGC